MRHIVSRAISHPALSLGSTLLWGLLEFVALQRSRRNCHHKERSPRARKQSRQTG